MTVQIVAESPPIRGTTAGLSVPLPVAIAGDSIYVHVLLYSPNSTVNVAMPSADREVEIICVDSRAEGGVVVAWHFVIIEIFNPVNFPAGSDFVTLSWPTNAVNTHSVYAARSYTFRGVDRFPSDADCVEAGPFIIADQPTPAMVLPTGTTLLIDLIISTGSAASGPPPAGFTAGPRVSITAGAGAWMRTWRRTAGLPHLYPAHPTEIPVPTTPPGDTGVYWIVGIALVPAPVVVPPILPPDVQPLTLDCADSYNVLITGPDYRTVVASVGWSSIEWSRVLDEVSTATVTIPDALGGVHCCADAGGLLPWRFGLLLERNDAEVWSGPVVGLARQGEALQVNASDVMARFGKRLVTRVDRTYTNVDAGAVFASLVNAAQFESDLWRFAAPQGITGTALTRTVQALDFETSLDVLNDLANSSIDYFVMNGTLFVHDLFDGWIYSSNGDTNTLLPGPYTASKELFYGLFTESCWSQRPDWSINGLEQGNAIWVIGPDSSTEGARRFWVAQDFQSQAFDGLLDMVDDNPLYHPAEDEIIPDPVFQSGAQSTLALRKIAPAVIEGGALAVGAPVDVPNLRPGALWLCDIYDACFGQLLQVARLKRVQVRVTAASSGITESIAPTLTPPGSRD